jgi:hypothetical protein
MKKEDVEKLDKWFLDNEGLSYKEFCDLYNSGQEIKDDLPFIDFPKEILKLLQGNIEVKLHPLFEKFLEKENIKELYLETLLLGTKDMDKTMSLIDFFSRNLNSTIPACHGEYINYAINFNKAKGGPSFWKSIEKKWNNFINEKL